MGKRIDWGVLIVQSKDKLIVTFWFCQISRGEECEKSDGEDQRSDSGGGNRLRVSFARYDRSDETTPKIGGQVGKNQSNKEHQFKGQTISQHTRGFVDGRLYAEVVKGKKNVENSEEINLDWLKRSLVGFIEQKTNPHQLVRKLQMKQVPFDRVQPWGDHKVIITFQSEENLTEMMGRCKEIWGDSVKQLRKWRKDNTRFTGEGRWFQCEGVPIQCWSKHCFDKIGSIWGRVMETDISTDFDRAWIRIAVDNEYKRFDAGMHVSLICGGYKFPIFLSPVTHGAIEDG